MLKKNKDELDEQMFRAAKEAFHNQRSRSWEVVPTKLVQAWLFMFGVLACLWAAQFWFSPSILPSPFPLSVTKQTIDGVHVSQVVSVYDGDTFKVDIEGWPAIIGDDISVRIMGIDTPEIRGTSGFEKEMALAAKQQLKDLLSKNTIYLYDLQRDKYFRILAGVKAGNIDVAERLIDIGLAKRYFGETKISWTESDYDEYKTKIAD